MKASSFFAGLALGAVAAIAASKKLKAMCDDEDDSCDNDAALKDAEDTVQSLRNSADSLLNDLKTQTEAKQTYAAQCEDLKDQLAKKDAEINNLKQCFLSTCFCDLSDFRQGNRSFLCNKGIFGS